MRHPLGPFARIPVRWRIAIACAGMTMAILVCFAAVLGSLVGDRIRADFDQELRDAARALASETTVVNDPALGPVISSPQLRDYALASDAIVRVVDATGRPLAGAGGTISLGPPRSRIIDIGSVRVATEPIGDPSVFGVFLQIGRPDASMEATVDRLWLFLGAGTLVGTLLALLAGLAVADRAMRPIAALTSLARDITTTRDPSRRMPVPAADDEVGELAQTMDAMLESLDEARTEREQAFDRQREFVADASHELRTPLTSVQANLELLQGSELASDDRHTVGSALGSARRMSRLVADLGLLARTDARSRRAAFTDLDLVDVTRAAVEEASALSHGRDLQARLKGPLPVHGNPDELHRMASNLVENALRHTPEGTPVEVSAWKQDGEAVLEVCDDGPGIPEPLRDQIFERFVRGDGPSDTTGGGGSGLGLAIVRAVADSHGGSVEVGESRTGGARFLVRVPLAATSSRPDAAEEDSTPASTPSAPEARGFQSL